jgi:hypothetical protein
MRLATDGPHRQLKRLFINSAYGSPCNNEKNAEPAGDVRVVPATKAEEAGMTRVVTVAIATLAIAITTMMIGAAVPASAEETGVGFDAPATTIQVSANRQYVRIRTSRGDAIVIKDRVPDGRKPSIIEYD